MTEETPDSQPETETESETSPDSEALVAAIERQLGMEKQDLLLVKMLGDTVDKLRDMTGEDDSGRVRFAAERALVAVAERVSRIFRRDLAVDKG